MLPNENSTPDTSDPIFDTLESLTATITTKLNVADFDAGLEKSALDTVAVLRQLRESPSMAAAAHTSKHRLLYLGALAMAAEVLEYFGQFGKDSEVYAFVKAEAPAICAGFNEQPAPDAHLDKLIAREEVWVVLNWARGLYRIHQYDHALQVVETCEYFVTHKLQTQNFSCHFTMATLWSLHARILRQVARLQEAKVYYDRALSRIYDRLQQHYGSDARVTCEVARILAFGHGWILYTQGLLHEARAAVSTALIILHNTNDVIYKAYADLLLSSVGRAVAGIERGTLDKIITDMERPYDTFKQYNHHSYAARAAYELALALLYRGLASCNADGTPSNASNTDFDRAQEYLSDALALDDPRWHANALVVMSRLQRARGNWFEAKQSAEKALRIATGAKLDFCMMDAYIAVGEALSAPPDATDQSLKLALQQFESASTLAGKNPKPAAVCVLHIARVQLKRGKLREAQGALNEWRMIAHKIQHGVVKKLADAVTADVEQASQRYYIVDTEQSLNIETHLDDVTRFLLTQADLRIDKIDTRLAKLGIKRATYYNLRRRVGAMLRIAGQKAAETESEEFLFRDRGPGRLS
jgi:tetratricopeptide (TPR) repeat protein